MTNADSSPATHFNAGSSTYDGFYFRNNLGSQGDVPSTDPFNVCPDIVGSRAAIPNAQAALSTPASWNASFSTDPVYGARNFYYVRGLDGANTGVENVPVMLYSAPSELILFPSTWKNNPLRTANGLDSVTVTAQPGGIGVGTDAFVWSPQPLDGQSDFYALVARAAESIPAVSTWTDMGALLTESLGFGFRNTLQVDADEANWVHRVGLNIPASFTSPGQIMLTLSTAGMTGATVGVLADAFGSDRKPMAILPAPIPGDSFTSGIQVTLAPGFSTSLAIEYWAGNARPAAGSTITVSASYVVPQQELAETSSRGLINPVRDRFLQQLNGIQPQATVLLGCVTFIVGN